MAKYSVFERPSVHPLLGSLGFLTMTRPIVQATCCVCGWYDPMYRKGENTYCQPCAMDVAHVLKRVINNV